MEQIGLEGKFEVSAFNAGLNAYIDGLAKAEAATTSAVSSLNNINAVVDALGKTSGSLGGASTVINGVVSDLGKLSSIGGTSQLPQFLSSIENALSGFGSAGNLDSATTSLNDLAYALDSISHVNLDANRLAGVTGGISSLVNDLSKAGNLGTAASSVGTLATSLESLSGLKFDTTGLDAVAQTLGDFGKIKNVDTIGGSVQQISAALTSIQSLQAVPQGVLTSISDLNLVLNDLGNIKSVGNLGGSLTQVTAALGGLASLPAIPQAALTSISDLNLVLNDLAQLPKLGSLGTSFTQLTSALSTINTIQPIGQPVLTSISDLNLVLNDLAQLPTIGNIGNQIGKVSAALGTLGTVQPIPQGVLTSVSDLNLVLNDLAQLPTIGNIGSQIGRVANALITLGTVQPIPAGVLNSVGDLNLVLNDLAALPTIGNIGGQISRVASALSSMGNIQPIDSAALASIGGLGSALGTLSSLPNLGSIGGQLSRVTAALSSLGTISAIPTAVASSITTLVTALQGLSGLGNIGTAVSSLGTLATSLNQLATAQPINPQVLANIQQLSHALSGIGGSANLQGFIQQLSQVSGAMGSFGTAAVATAGQANTLGSALQNGLAVGFGIQAINMFTQLAGAIREAGAEAFNTVAYFERLGFTVQSVVADTLRAKDSSLTFADALEKAKVPAQGVLQVLDKLSLASPFSPIEVDHAFQTATAYGLTANEALRLTKAFTDFAAARGLPGDNLQRISLAVSQISAKGKLMAQEMNQLAEAGVPIRQILGEALHLTRDQLNALLEGGAIPANDAINAIVSSMEKYSGSAQRATHTFSGLVSTLQEIKQLGERDLFTAAFAPLQPLLASFVDFASSDQFSAGLQVLGELIGVQVKAAVDNLTAAVMSMITGWKSLNPNVQEGVIVFGLAASAAVAAVVAFGGLELIIGALITPFSLVIAAVGAMAAAWVENFGGIQEVTYSTISGISDALATVATEAVDWGNNIISSLAQGIEGAVNLVLEALSVVGAAIQDLLQPGSPPKLLPNLDKWGAGAASAYLEGFKDADFSFLDTFGNLIASHLRNQVSLGKGSEKALPERIVGSRAAIEEAINQIATVGSVTDEVITRISKNAKLSHDAVATYINDYAQVRISTEAVNTAQQALTDSVKAYDDQINPLQQHLNALKKAQTDAEDQKKIAQLQRTIANTGVTAARRKQAQLELDTLLTQRQIDSLTEQKTAEQAAGQAKVDSATAAAQAAKDQLDIFGKQQGELLNIESIYAQIAQATKQTTADASERKKKFDAELDPLNKQLDALKLQSEALKDHVREAELKHILEDKTATAAEKAAAAFELQELAVKKQIRAVEASRLAKEGFPVDLSAIEKIPVVLKDIEKSGKKTKPVLDSVFGAFKGLSDTSIGKALSDFNKTLEQTRLKVTGLGSAFTPLITHLNQALPAFLSLKAGADGTVPAVTALKVAFELFGTFFASTKLIAILENIPSVLGFIFTKSNLIVAAISLLATAWFNDWGGIREVTAGAVDFIKTKFKELTGITGIEDVKTKFAGFTDAIKGFFTNPDTLVGQTTNKATSLIGSFIAAHFSKESITNGLATVKDNLGGFFKSVQGYFDDPTSLGGEAKQATTQAVGFLAKWVSDHFNEATVTAALGTVSTLLSTFFSGVQGYFDGPTTEGGGAKQTATGTLGYLPQWVADHFNETTINAALTLVSGSLATLFSGVQGYFDNPTTVGGQAKKAVTQAVGYLSKWVADHFNETTVNAALATVSTELGTFFSGVQGYFDDPTTVGGAAKKATIQAVGMVEQWVLDHFNETTINNALGLVSSNLTTFFSGIQGYFDDPTTIGGEAKKAATEAFDYLAKFVTDHFSQTQIDATLATLTKIISDFRISVQAELNKPQATETAGGGGSQGLASGQSSMLDKFMLDNFGPGAVGKALTYLVGQWSTTASIIVDDLIKPLGDAMDKDSGLDLGTRLGNLYIRSFGISLGAALKYIIGVFIPNLVFALFGLYWAWYNFFYVTLPSAVKGLFIYLTGDGLSALKDSIGSIVKGFDDGIDLMMKAFGYDKVKPSVEAFKTGVKNDFNSIVTYLTVDLPSQLTSVGETILGTVTASIQNFFKNTALGRLLTIGAEIIAGVFKGLADKLDKDVTTAMATAMGTILSAILTYFGIASPSTLMHDKVGDPVGAGVLGGIKDHITNTDNIGKLVVAFTSLVGSIFSTDNIAKFTTAAFNLGASIFTSIGDGIQSLVKSGGDLLSGILGGGDATKKDTSKAGDAQAKQLQDAMAALLKSIDDTSITAKLNNIVLAFLSAQGLATYQIQTLADNIIAILTQLNTDIQGALLLIEITFLNDFQYIVDQVGIKMELLHTNTNTTLDNMNTDVQAKLTDLMNKALAIFVKLHHDALAEVNSMKSDIVSAFGSLRDDVLSKIGDLKDKVVQIFKDMATESLKAIDQFKTDLIAKLDSILSDLKNKFNTGGLDVGHAFGDGIAQGIKDKIAKIKQAAQDAASAAKDAAKNTVQAKSPAKALIREFGQPFSQGMALGILKDMDKVVSAATRVAQAGVDAAYMVSQRTGVSGGGISSISNSRTNVFNLNVNSNQSSRGITRDFGIMTVMAG